MSNSSNMFNYLFIYNLFMHIYYFFYLLLSITEKKLSRKHWKYTEERGLRCRKYFWIWEVIDAEIRFLSSLKYDYVTVALHWRNLLGKFIKKRDTRALKRLLDYRARVHLRNAGKEWIMFALSEQLMAFIRSPRGAPELRASSRGARNSRFFIYTPGKRPVVIGRHLGWFSRIYYQPRGMMGL